MVVDTNILIAFLNNEKTVLAAITEWQAQGRSVFVSSVSYGELLSKKGMTADERKRILALQEDFVIIELNSVIAAHVGEIRQIQPSIRLPDAAIAATSIYTHTPLVTRDIRMHKIQGIRIVTV